MAAWKSQSFAIIYSLEMGLMEVLVFGVTQESQHKNLAFGL